MKVSLKPLHHRAHTFFNQQKPRQDVLKEDCSEDFVRELQQRRNNGNIISGLVRGEQSSGKSLVGFTLTKHGNTLHNIPMKIQHIAADQIDFLDKVRDSSLTNCCMLIDEWNELSTTGYNASVNQAFLVHFQEVQAQRFIDRWACSPEKIIDPTARIILDVVEKVIKEKFTRCYVYYVIYVEGIRIEQPVGFMDVDVSESLHDPLYDAYRQRKFKRFEMLLDKKIIDNRSKDESEVILAVVKKLITTVKRGELLSKDMIRSKIKKMQKRFTAVSIWGEEKLTSEIYGTLLYLKNVNMLNRRIIKKKKAIDKSDNFAITKELQQELQDLKHLKADFLKDFQEDIDYHQDIIETMEQFEDIGSEDET